MDPVRNLAEAYAGPHIWTPLLVDQQRSLWVGFSKRTQCDWDHAAGACYLCHEWDHTWIECPMLLGRQANMVEISEPWAQGYSFEINSVVLAHRYEEAKLHCT